MNSEVETQIRNNISWSKLPTNIRQLVGNSQKEYEKAIVSYCIRNQSRFKDTLVRYVRKDEKRYYEELLQYSKEHFMLYPYHLSDLFVRGLRITPFNYYLDMMEKLMLSEKSYDSLPNFTAFDCVRLLGIGRNQYIDIMNRYRSSNNKTRISFTRRKPNSIRNLLPTQPIDILIEPWWLVNVGCVAEEDVKVLSDEEKYCIDILIDNQRPIVAGKLNYDSVNALYKKGLIYLDVPLNENDYVEVPPLESFVMNRILGDYFETLLYKLFVSIDDHTSLGELASLLQIDLDLVLNAVSLYCRLSFAVKKQKQEDCQIEGAYDSTWKDYKKRIKKNNSGETLLDWNNVNLNEDSSDCESKLISTPNSDSELKQAMTNEINSANSLSSNNKRIGFLFDSTLTAFLMMGNLSSGLKNHAVTMFEVGKLSDQALDNFLHELEKVSNDQSEGEAQRYFDHARILKSTIQFLRYNSQLKVFSGFSQKSEKASENEEKTEFLGSADLDRGQESTKVPIENEPMGLDLLRCESLMSLDEESRQRILAKNYSVLFSMAPYSSSGENSAPITCDIPFHIGPCIPEVNSVWFKLFLYELTGNGPVSLLLPKGYRLNSLPESFLLFDKFMVITWGHDPVFVPHYNLLITLNDALTHGPLLVECYSESEEGTRTINIPFNDTTHPLFDHPSVKILHESLGLKHFSGYITLINPYNTINLGKEYKENFDEWHILDLHYGIPLFDNKLNLNILSLFKENNLGTFENLNSMLQINRRLSLELISFIQKYQLVNVVDKTFFDVPNSPENYLMPVIASKTRKPNQPKVCIYPTQALLFEENKMKIVNNL